MRVGDSREFQDLLREVSALRRRIDQRPMRGGGGGAAESFVQLRIIDGNTITVGSSTYYGIPKYSGDMAEVASLWNPNVSLTPGAFSAEDGIGRATLYVNGVAQTGPVLVVFDDASPIPTVLLNTNICTASATTRKLTLASDPTQFVLAYVPIFR